MLRLCLRKIMRLWRPRRLAGISASLALALKLLEHGLSWVDWFVGKVGYLGLFTSPEDIRTAQERLRAMLPRWLYDALAFIGVAVADTLRQLGVALRWVWSIATADAAFWVLLAVAFALIVYDTPRAVRLRHRIRFRWRRALAGQVWITRDTAFKVVKESPWGRLKEPNVVRAVSLFDVSMLTRERVVYGMSDTEKALLKFKLYVERTLNSFCASNPSACRSSGDGQEIEEGALRKFLDKAVDEEVSGEFGEAPDYKVT